ncbi:hypothetical protein BHT95_15960 [Bacillus paralicheniformis]|nr:hypothetical protein BHT95_15960 [Bacillus paralicheniformis]TWM56428.1 hypothetical protein CHCC14814_2409 [Bacillus paralicheniformis]
MIAFSVLCDGAIRLTELSFTSAVMTSPRPVPDCSQCRRVRSQTEKTGVSMKNQHKKRGRTYIYKMRFLQ